MNNGRNTFLASTPPPSSLLALLTQRWSELSSLLATDVDFLLESDVEKYKKMPWIDCPLQCPTDNRDVCESSYLELN